MELNPQMLRGLVKVGKDFGPVKYEGLSPRISLTQLIPHPAVQGIHDERLKVKVEVGSKWQVFLKENQAEV